MKIRVVKAWTRLFFRRLLRTGQIKATKVELAFSEQDNAVYILRQCREDTKDISVVFQLVNN